MCGGLYSVINCAVGLSSNYMFTFSIRQWLVDRSYVYVIAVILATPISKSIWSIWGHFGDITLGHLLLFGPVERTAVAHNVDHLAELSSKVDFQSLRSRGE
jgi:hypothetical protein